MRGQIKVKDKPEDVFEKIMGLNLVMFAHNIESDEYGKAVFHAVDDNMEEEDFSMMGEVI